MGDDVVVEVEVMPYDAWADLRIRTATVAMQNSANHRGVAIGSRAAEYIAGSRRSPSSLAALPCHANLECIHHGGNRY